MVTNSTNINITIKNYRCFPDEKPVHITMRNGFTAFVGVNNSGKSALLKLFYELRGLFSGISRSSDDLLHALRNSRAFTKAVTVEDNNELFCNANLRDISFEIKVNASINNKQTDGVLPEKIVFTIPRGENTYGAQIFLPNNEYLDTKKPSISVKHVGNSYIKIENTLIDMEAYYQAFEAFSNTVYIGPFRNAVNIGGNENYYDMTIGQPFITLWDNYKSGKAKKNTEAALRLTQDIQHIFRFESLEINASIDNQTLHVIVNGKPYRLEELGSGLSQFTVILANIAIKKPSWVLIDEPELNLHPSLQIDFLTTLASYATEGIIFSTHNIGLARACAERIYSFLIDDKGQKEVRDFETITRLSEFLGELSYAGYKDIGFNTVLLVEGSTEVKTIQQFLRKYGKDHKIVLLSLGGSTLIKSSSEFELEEIKRITNGNISALIDSERKSADAPLPAERQQFFEICQKSKINCHVLKLRAMENYLSDRAVKVIKGKKYHALDPYERLEEASPSWGKQDNWRIAREMTLEELNNTDLGQFLQSL